MSAGTISLLFIIVGSVLLGIHFDSPLLGIGIGFVAFGIMPDFSRS